MKSQQYFSLSFDNNFSFTSHLEGIRSERIDGANNSSFCVCNCAVFLVQVENQAHERFDCPHARDQKAAVESNDFAFAH